MTEKEALSILSLEEGIESDIMDAFELACFQEKQSLYKDPILPPIIDARIKKVKRLSEAFIFLLKTDRDKQETTIVSIHELDDKDWKVFFNLYEQNKASLRKALANQLSGAGIISILEQMKTHEISYGKILQNNVPIEIVSEVKVSSQMPIIEIVTELNTYLEQGLIDNSFESLKKWSEINASFKLRLEVSRVKKLLNGQ